MKIAKMTHTILSNPDNSNKWNTFQMTPHNAKKSKQFEDMGGIAKMTSHNAKESHLIRYYGIHSNDVTQC